MSVNLIISSKEFHVYRTVLLDIEFLMIRKYVNLAVIQIAKIVQNQAQSV